MFEPYEKLKDHFIANLKKSQVVIGLTSMRKIHVNVALYSDAYLRKTHTKKNKTQ
jgi:hypothetical protein